ncbi:hypothetical protein GALL_489670 [mine drainage metagenome]|uniref:Uncharacterized protein n=1 Tax=mine drainage metagenome TaxID=410659 RepID=A0A1J5PDY4_9ZZZZ
MQRLGGPDDDIAHHRVDAVGADDRIRRRRRPVGKGQRHRPAVLVQSDQFLVQVDDLARHDGGQRLVQVRPMHAKERRPIKIFRHRQLALELAGVADAVEVGVRREGALAQHGLDTDAAQNLHRVRQHLDARADAAELMRLFEYLDVDTRLSKRAGRGHAAHPGADDCNFG